MNRRQLLVTSGTGLATALSGCSALSGGSDGESDGSGDDSTSGSDGDSDSGETATTTDTPAGPASFEEVSLAAADGAQIGSELTLTVSATNVGGETGTYEGTVRLAASGDESADDEENSGPSFETSFEIDSVSPGETGETEITGPAFETVDDYEFVVAESDASVTVRPEPETAAVGETLAVGQDLAVTVDDVSVQESVFTPSFRSSGLSTYEEVSAFGAPSGHVLAVVTVTAENTGTQTTSAERGTLGITDAEWYGDGEGAPDSILGRSDSRFTAGGLPEIAPSESATGYFIAQVPRDTARGTIEITGQADATGTLPERVWTAEPSGDERSLPELTFESVDAPETTQLGRDYEITATVANEGDATGTLRGVVQWEDDTAWAQLSVATSHAELDTERPTGGVVRREVDPGVSTEITLTSFTTVNGQYTYRFQPFGDEWQVDFQEAMLAFGDRLKYDGNANIVVEDLRTQDTVTAYDDFDGEEFEAEPDDGNQYVAVQLRFEKRDETEDYASTPESGNFWLTAGGNSVSDSTYIGDEIREDWYEPIEGELENQPEITGWTFREVPSEYAAADLAVRFEEGGGFGSDVSTVATWEQ
mgnify:CR=1 FL=1